MFVGVYPQIVCSVEVPALYFVVAVLLDYYPLPPLGVYIGSLDSRKVLPG